MNQKSDFRLSNNSKPNKWDQIIIIVVTDSTLSNDRYLWKYAS